MGDIREFAAGWSISRLADEFRLDRRTVTKRIRDASISPAGQRNGHNVYSLTDVAAFLVDPLSLLNGDLDPRDLPPQDRRAYYQSENERLKVEMTIGKLITAQEVEGDYADMVKLVVQFFDTLPDVLERDAALSPHQVQAVQDSCDRVRQGLYDTILAEEPPIQEFLYRNLPESR